MLRLSGSSTHSKSLSSRLISIKIEVLTSTVGSKLVSTAVSLTLPCPLRSSSPLTLTPRSTITKDTSYPSVRVVRRTTAQRETTSTVMIWALTEHLRSVPSFRSQSAASTQSLTHTLAWTQNTLRSQILDA